MKYRLKKSYPNCPVTVGTVIIQDNPNDWVTADEAELGLKDTDVTEFPEFWKLIVEKEYEILSFIYKTNKNRIFTKVVDIYSAYKCLIDEGCISHHSMHKKSIKYIFKLFDIYSIKRLSDGEVFTIGDKIVAYDGYTKGIWVINNIKFGYNQTDNIFFDMASVDKKNTYEGLPLDYASKAKTPLFTTEDSVDIFGNSTVYRVNQVGLNFVQPWVILENYNIGYNNAIFYNFSTKEAAEEYILYNKPCLSIKDIDDINEYPSKATKMVLSRIDLKQVIKSKL